MCPSCGCVEVDLAIFAEIFLIKNQMKLKKNLSSKFELHFGFTKRRIARKFIGFNAKRYKFNVTTLI